MEWNSNNDDDYTHTSEFAHRFAYGALSGEGSKQVVAISREFVTLVSYIARRHPRLIKHTTAQWSTASVASLQSSRLNLQQTADA